METTTWTVPDLIQMSGGYWNACALHAAVKLDIFSNLDGVALTAGEIAQRRKTDPRATGMLLDALSGLGLLEKNGSTYTNSLFSEQNLSKASPTYMGHILMHHHHLMPSWAQLADAVTTGAQIRGNDSHDDNGTVRESFLMGMFNLASLLAPRITQAVGLPACRSLLDLGGGPGTYAIYFCIANPDLSAVVYDLPTSRAFAEKTVSSFDLSKRITFTPGDYHIDPLPFGFDAVWMSHVLHIDGFEACSSLLRKAVATLNPGGILMVQEFILNDAKDGPVFPALFSLNMLLGTEAGRSYSGKELMIMMTEAGLSDVHRLELELPNGAGIMSGRLP